MINLPPECMQLLLEYTAPVKSDVNLSSEQLKRADDAATASYAYGIVVGLCLASALAGKPLLSALMQDEPPDTIIGKMVGAALPYEEAFVAEISREIENIE